jgi:glycopeptide antibiotics resistance protein
MVMLMNYYLFAINLKLAYIITFIFLFIVPIVIELLKRKKFLIITYLIIFLLALFLGVFTNVKISSDSVSFSLLITNHWFNTNNFTIAYFSTFAILVNLFLLFPFGYIYPSLSKKKVKFYQVLLAGFILAFSIEFLQFVLPIVRYPEVLDVINNTISVILGYLYYLLIKKIKNRGEKA